MKRNMRNRRVIPTMSANSPLKVDGKTARERQREYALSLKRPVASTSAAAVISPNKRRRRNPVFPSPNKSRRLESIRRLEEQRERKRQSMAPNNLITTIEQKAFTFQSDERHQLHSERFKNRVNQWRQFEKDQKEFQSTEMPDFKQLHAKSSQEFSKRKKAAREQYTETQPVAINLTTETRSKTGHHLYIEERERLREQHREQQAAERLVSVEYKMK